MIEPPDSHYLRAAIGWLELGNLIEAKKELAHVTPALQQHAEVLGVGWQICAHAGRWDEALTVAKNLIESTPERSMGWIFLAYSLRRVKGGGLNAARQLLLQTVNRFPEEAIIPYNLACYEAQLGQLEQAWQWLGKAVKIGGASEIKKMALADPDLKPLGARLHSL